MSNLYLKNLRGKNWDLVIACCVEALKLDALHRDGLMLDVDGFTWKNVSCHPMRLKSLFVRGIIERVPDTRDPYEYVAPAETIGWYHEHTDGSDPVAL